MLNPYVKALRQADFSLSGNDVRIENFSLPFLKKENGSMEVREPLPYEFLFPWQNNAAWSAQKTWPGAKLTLLHFSLHECAPCHTEVKELQNLFAGGKLPPNVQLWQVVGGTNATALIANEMLPILPDGARTHLDLEDGLSERLGVIGAPATWILDEAGLVVGYRNGALNFDTPGMDVLWARLAEWPRVQAQFPGYTSLAKAASDPAFVLSDSWGVTILKKLPVSAILLTALLIVGGLALLRTLKKW
jgi:hypothetical protein